MDGYLPFPLGLNPVHPPFLFMLGLFWLVTGDIRYAICCVITSYNGSEIAPFTCESVSVPTTAALAFISDTLLPSVSVLAFLEAITN